MRLASKGFILKVHQVQAEIVEEYIMKGKVMQKISLQPAWGFYFSSENCENRPELWIVFKISHLNLYFQNLYFLLWLVGSKHLIQISIFQNFQSSKGSPTGKLCLINGVHFITCWCLLKSLKISNFVCKC